LERCFQSWGPFKAALSAAKGMDPIKPDVGFLPKNVSPAVNFALAKETKVLKPVPSFEAKTPVQTIAPKVVVGG
jgi:hypothetical protein